MGHLKTQILVNRDLFFICVSLVCFFLLFFVNYNWQWRNGSEKRWVLWMGPLWMPIVNRFVRHNGFLNEKSWLFTTRCLKMNIGTLNRLTKNKQHILMAIFLSENEDFRCTLSSPAWPRQDLVAEPTGRSCLWEI